MPSREHAASLELLILAGDRQLDLALGHTAQDDLTGSFGQHALAKPAVRRRLRLFGYFEIEIQSVRAAN